ncbi:MAG: hypothetical protein ACI92S_003337 [Planctomycetaceae bacterium]|jgi:hypothetical protein
MLEDHFVLDLQVLAKPGFAGSFKHGNRDRYVDIRQAERWSTTCLP